MVSKVKCAMATPVGAVILEVQADVSGGLPDMDMTGNLGTSAREGRDRVRIAIKRSGFSFPQGRVMVNIAPASVHKEGTGFDLAVAACIFMECGIIPQDSFENILLVGELALDGSVKGVRGILPIIIRAKEYGLNACIVPKDNCDEAYLIEGIKVLCISSLRELVDYACGRTIENDLVSLPDNKADIMHDEPVQDFACICGQEHAKRALLTAVCGMHNIMLLGPPGTGKTLLSSCVPGIMPDMSEDEALSVWCLYSLVGEIKNKKDMLKRPFRTPHHSITACAMAGGGRMVMPGEVSLSGKGVLFLDEITKFKPQVIELLREPLESGRIMINRAAGSYELPADFMLIAAMNPCLCSWYPDMNRCTCSQREIKNHYGKVSKPILDRIDMSIYLSRMEYNELIGQKVYDKEFFTTANMKRIVERVWKKQHERLGEGCFNSRMNIKQVEEFCVLDNEGDNIMRRAYDKYELSARAYHKILKTARTIADINEREFIAKDDLLEALSYRLSV